MDPDLVRQQAEAELEQRNGARVLAKSNPPPDVPQLEAAFAPPTEQPVSPAVMDAPVSVPVPIATRAEPIKPSRWRVHVQAVFSSSALAGLAALASAAWGAQQGLSADEQLWIGSGAAVLMALIYGVVLSINGNNFTPASSGH